LERVKVTEMKLLNSVKVCTKLDEVKSADVGKE
jgi:hypothetical protein